MSEADEVMLYRAELEQLLSHLYEIRDIYVAEHRDEIKQTIPRSKLRIPTLCGLWIDRIGKILRWR